MIGAGTALADNPDLTCRLPGLELPAKVRVVVDSRLRTPLTARLMATASAVPTWFLARDDADAARRRAVEQTGAVVLSVPGSESGLDIAAGLALLGERGITRVLAEGGARLASTLLRAELVDRLVWFHAPAVMGGDGFPASATLGTEMLSAMPRFIRERAAPVGDDMLTEFRRAA
jgi:diaminohydroxyphosphoribosylaminopyrimidine deaminase/5-amino-6-(5-phosphoribosylamino)uracil reductase